MSFFRGFSFRKISKRLPFIYRLDLDCCIRYLGNFFPLYENCLAERWNRELPWTQKKPAKFRTENSEMSSFGDDLATLISINKIELRWIESFLNMLNSDLLGTILCADEINIDIKFLNWDFPKSQTALRIWWFANACSVGTKLFFFWF